jgi:hypothetical protein
MRRIERVVSRSGNRKDRRDMRLSLLAPTRRHLMREEG